jgi:endonuclease YncB( thermonuclease family)
MQAGARGVAIGIVAGWLVVAAAHSAPLDTCLATGVKEMVREAADARSLSLTDGRVIRLAGIEPFSVLTSDPQPIEEALVNRLNVLAAHHEVAFQATDAAQDRYGRFVAIAAIDGKLLQEIVASEGLAIAFASGDPLPCFDRIVAAENEARKAHRGFWTGGLPDARPEELDSWIGRLAIFEGKVLSVGNRRSRTYLNFGFRWTEDVTAEIAADHRELFGGEAALEALKGQRVRVRGYLQENGGPLVTLRSPMQLEILPEGPKSSGKAP